MKKDIPQLKVEGLGIAIVPREDPMEIDLWDTYLINFKDAPIQGVFINSKGYGKLEGEEIKTTTLRHFFEEIEGHTAQKIEPIQAKLFTITNEYWVSFKFEEYMYDKKYVFVKGSIDQMNFTTIPFLDKKGVMIK